MMLLSQTLRSDLIIVTLVLFLWCSAKGCSVCTIGREYNYFHPGERRNVIKVQESSCFQLIDNHVILADSTFYVKVQLASRDTVQDEEFVFVLQDDLYCENNCCSGLIKNTRPIAVSSTPVYVPLTTPTPTRHFFIISNTFSVTRPACVDTYSSCSFLQKNICSEIETWARQNCAKYCSFCS